MVFGEEWPGMPKNHAHCLVNRSKQQFLSDACKWATAFLFFVRKISKTCTRLTTSIATPFTPSDYWSNGDLHKWKHYDMKQKQSKQRATLASNTAGTVFHKVQDRLNRSFSVLTKKSSWHLWNKGQGGTQGRTYQASHWSQSKQVLHRTCLSKCTLTCRHTRTCTRTSKH